VLKGRVFDVAVDLRRGSSTYGQWCGATLTDAAGEQLFVPRGFAHGYCTLEPGTEIAYKVDGYYAVECDAGLRWNDPAIGIEWPVAEADVVLNERDRKLPLLNGTRQSVSYLASASSNSFKSQEPDHVFTANAG
jgi:dTDP-4-dehydrorhamnose 3,5-epimerase